MSAIIVTLLLVMLSIVLIGIVWTVINSMIKSKVSSASSCFGNFDKVTLNSKYTCYNSSTSHVQFSLNVGDIALDGVVVAMSNAAQSKSFEIKNTSQTIANLTTYSGITSTALPGNNSGATYLYYWPGNPPDSIEISPVISGTTCSSSDSISPISDCNLLS